MVTREHSTESENGMLDISITNHPQLWHASLHAINSLHGNVIIFIIPLKLI